MWSIPPSRILVPVDFSEASGRAVEVAAALASRVGAEVHLLHAEILEVPAYFTREQTQALERERIVARTRAHEFLSDFARAHGATTFTSEIVEGLPTPTLLDAAAKADLVVMGTHGRRGPARWWLGSVAERVVHQSPAPVLVVRAGTRSAPIAVFERPVVFAGQAEAGAGTVRAAAGLAAAAGGQVQATAASCAADLAADARATLVVVPAAGRHGTLLSHPAEQWLRSCTLPMLFVPEVAAAS
jgi:nucleotide-binding universal stress UspA family protein